MPNFSGIWTVTQQMQARGASTWPAVPGAPTIGTATAGTARCASVTFTAPGCTGAYPAGVTGYRVISTPGCVTVTGASSPLVVTGLTAATSYTFKAQATNANGYGALSAASNAVTATLVTCATYTTAGSYSWVAPAGVTSVSVVAIGAGGRNTSSTNYQAGSGGGLGYKNNISVTPGNSYSVNVTAPQAGNCTPAYSYFISSATVAGQGGRAFNLATGGSYVGDGGGIGGCGGQVNGLGRAGGGAGGYAGKGGNSSYWCYCAGSGVVGNGAGGGGGGGATHQCGAGAGGGGVGVFGQGASGAGGAQNSPASRSGGGGGSGGSAGTSSSGYLGGNGGAYGGGGGSTACGCAGTNTGSGGAVRIVWCKCGARGTPSFPSTNVGP